MKDYAICNGFISADLSWLKKVAPLLKARTVKIDRVKGQRFILLYFGDD